jgi:hypothetical protein
VPKLAGFFKLDHPVRLQGLKRAEGGGNCLTCLFRQYGKRLAGTLDKMFKQVKRPVQSLDGVLAGLVVEGLRSATRFLSHLTSNVEKAQTADFHR